MFPSVLRKITFYSALSVVRPEFEPNTASGSHDSEVFVLTENEGVSTRCRTEKKELICSLMKKQTFDFGRTIALCSTRPKRSRDGSHYGFWSPEQMRSVHVCFGLQIQPTGNCIAASRCGQSLARLGVNRPCDSWHHDLSPPGQPWPSDARLDESTELQATAWSGSGL